MPEEDLERIYLTLEDALELYAAIIDATTEQAPALLRSRPRLEGALARPATYAHYQDADLALQAAVLAHGIAESQAFVDGNKRLALVAILTSSKRTATASRRPTPSSPTGSSASAGKLTPDQLAEDIRPRLLPEQTD